MKPIGRTLLMGWGLLCVGLPGCPGPNSGPTDPRGRAGKSSLDSAQTIRVKAFWVLPDKIAQVSHLPPFPRFRDPYPVPRMSLKRHRQLSHRSRGVTRQLVLSHLAARLWRLANLKIDSVRRLAEAALAAGRPRPRERMAALQRQVSAHLRECVVLLEGVLETRLPPELARVRLAHYLRGLKPTASAALFEKLLSQKQPPALRQSYGLDLAQLWITMGRNRSALRLLERETKGARGVRALLLAAIANLRGGGASTQLSVLLGRLLEVSKTVPPSVWKSLSWHLPGLLARLARPAAMVQRWSRAAPEPYRARGAEIVGRLIERLVARGRLAAAARVNAALERTGLRLANPLRVRVQRLVGPWKPTAAAVPPLRWKSYVQARLPALVGCFGRRGDSLVGWSLVLRIRPDGTVADSVNGPAQGRRLHATPPGSKGAAGATTAAAVIGRCVERRARTWHFPPWRAAHAVRLVVAIQSNGATSSPAASP